MEETKKPIWMIITTVVITALIVGGGVYYWQNKKLNDSKNDLNNQITTLQKQVNDLKTASTTASTTTTPSTTTTSATTTTADPTADWQTYTNSEFGFTMKYPSEWRVNGTKPAGDYTVGLVSFFSPTVQNDSTWGLEIFNKSKRSKEQIISSMGDQFADRAESSSSVEFNSIVATKVIVTTPSNPDWYSVQIIFEKGNNIYAFSNGAIKNSEFDLSYQSFQFTK